MSRDFDKAQEMVWASMEYVKVLGFRLRRTEGQRDDWKKVAQSHSDDLIACRQQLDALKAERNALRSTTIDTATGHLLDAFGSLANEPRNGAPDAEYRDRIVTTIHAIKLERDALKKERDDLRRVFSLVHGSLGINQGEHIGNAIEALKKERDCANAERARHEAQSRSLVADVLRLTAEIERLKKPARQHPVKVGEWLKRTSFDHGPNTRIGAIAKVVGFDADGDYQVSINGTVVCWCPSNCTPCDPPEATHITPAGKETAQAAAEPKPGDVVRLVREPTHTDIPAMLPWSKAFGMPGDTATVVKMAVPNKLPEGTIPVRTGMGRAFFWPLSCIEMVKGADK